MTNKEAVARLEKVNEQNLYLRKKVELLERMVSLKIDAFKNLLLEYDHKL